MVLGLPLAVGMTSECEHADFQTGAEIEPQEFMRKLNDSLPDGIRVTAAAVNDSGRISWQWFAVQIILLKYSLMKC